ncbi:phage/plasmid primase, P4 family [Anaerotignum sp.]|jgi:putative DNA primase/helicase|uniref:phage/plasmid primase, P4 family n=1 Tax=Anaerotignum sp. TaxID=2039241 RepID=UPI003AB5D107
MQLFRGYVPTKDKQCLEKFKGRKRLNTLEDVQDLDEYAAILGEETILIDVDDGETSDLLFKIVQDLALKCRVYATTRGKHFYFKNPEGYVEKSWTKQTLALGIETDAKVGRNNSYAIMRFKGVDRPMLQDCPEDEIQELPKWLTPVKTNMKFLDMEAGDGRNQSLFNYILTLQSEDFTKEEARETIRLINRYVLSDPLSERELETILRDDAFKKPVFFKGSTFLFDKFATYLKNNNHIVKINGQLHIYKDGIYVPGHAEIESQMIKHIPHLKRANRSEVLAYLEIMIDGEAKTTNPNVIAFTNGLYNIKDGSFRDFTPDVVITNKIPWPYNPAAYSELLDHTLDRLACNDPEVRALLEEMVGYCLYRRNELGKAFILIGDKSNGKSTFLHVVKNMLGDSNIASLDLKELGDRFKTAELFGKLANIGDDIGDEFIANASVFKKLVTGDRVNVERKGQDPFEFNNYAKFLFSANNIPRMKDKTGAVQRRLVIVPFDAKFTPNDPDFRPFIKDELCEQDSMEYLIVLGLKALKSVLGKAQFTTSKRVQGQLDEYEQNNNPIIGFIQEVGLDGIVNEATNTVYRRYKEYCIANNFQALSAIEFSRQICKRCGFVTDAKYIKGKKTRVFVEGTGGEE